MNMMVNTSDLLIEADTEKNKNLSQKKAISKLLAAWESRSAQKAKTFGGLGFLAVSLAACNSSSDDTTPVVSTPTETVPTTPTVVTNAPVALTDSTTADVLIGDGGNDTFSGSATTFANTDQIVDSSTTDSDTFTLTFNAVATPNVRNVETITIELQNVAATTLTASSITGATVLNFSRGDISLAGSTVTGDKSVTIDDVDAGSIPTINITGTATTVDINAAATDAGGAVINANTATGNVNYNNPGTINAAASTGTVAIDGVAHATSAALPITINAAAALTITTHASAAGVITIDGAAATTVTVNNASGGGTVTALKGGGTGITANSVDVTGFTITTGSYASTAAGTISIGGTTATTDTITISGAGSINLDVSGNTAAVDVITLGANGANVTYTIAASNGEATSYAKAAAAAGAQASTATVTVAGDQARFDTKTVTGVDVLDLTASAATATALDGSNWSAAKVDLGYSQANNAITYNADAIYEITADQVGGLIMNSKTTNLVNNIKIIAGDDNGTSTAVGTIQTGGVLDLNGTSTTDDVRSGTITLEAIVANFTTTNMDFGAKMNLTVTGDEDVTLGTVTGGASSALSGGGMTGKLNLTTTTLLPSVTSGTGADTIVVNGADVHTINSGGGADTITITATNAASSFTAGDGDDIINVDDVDIYVVAGGAGNDTFNTSAAIKATIAAGDGSTDQIVIDTDTAVTFDPSMRMSGMEIVDITSMTGTKRTTMDPATFASDNTFALKGNATTDIFKVIPAVATSAVTIDASSLTVASSNTVTIEYEGGTAADTITGGVAAETFLHSGGGDTYEGGSTGTDTYSIADTTIAAGAKGIAATSAASTGYIINLGSTALTSGSIYAGISKYAGAGQDVASGKGMHAYDASAATNDTDTDTIGGIETFVLGDGVDYFVGSAEAETITGGAGADYLSGGDGNDTFISDGTTNNGSDKIHGGLGAEDTLSVTGSTVYTTTDADITGIEKVTLTGAVDVTLLGQSEGFTITGSTGANVIKGGQGADTIALQAGTNADVIHSGLFSANGLDVVTGFDTTEDHLDFDVSMTGITNVVAVTDLAAGAGDANFIDNEAYVYADGATASSGAGTNTITDYTNLTQVAAFLSDAQTDNTSNTSNDTVTGDEAIFVINDLVANKTHAYHFKESGVGTDASAGVTVIAGELTHLYTVTEESGAALVAADIV